MFISDFPNLRFPLTSDLTYWYLPTKSKTDQCPPAFNHILLCITLYLDTAFLKIQWGCVSVTQAIECLSVQPSHLLSIFKMFWPSICVNTPLKKEKKNLYLVCVCFFNAILTFLHMVLDCGNLSAIWQKPIHITHGDHGVKFCTLHWNIKGSSISPGIVNTHDRF